MKLILLTFLIVAPIFGTRGAKEGGKVSGVVASELRDREAKRRSRLDSIFDFPVSRALGIDVHRKEPAVYFGAVR